MGDTPKFSGSEARLLGRLFKGNEELKTALNSASMVERKQVKNMLRACNNNLLSPEMTLNKLDKLLLRKSAGT